MNELRIKQKDWDTYITNGLSIYAATGNSGEFMAEAFSEWTSSANPRIIAKTAGRIIDSYLKGK